MKRNYSPSDYRLMKDINDNPTLMSILYDCDLLPEQLEPGTDRWKYMALAVSAFMIGKAEGSKKESPGQPPGADQKNNNERGIV